MVINNLFRIKKCNPDVIIQDNFDLNAYGINAKVISIPGHSSGSVGIITDEGDFICGDIFENFKKPKIGPIIDDKIEAESSMNKIKTLKILRVYPGHGRSFDFSELKLN